MSGVIHVTNWEQFQHYKERNPPWIKLHRTVLDKREYRDLTDGEARLLFELWMIASEKENNIPADVEWIAWRLRVSVRWVLRHIQGLVKTEWLTLEGQLAIPPLAERKPEARQRREEKRRDREEAEERKDVPATRRLSWVDMAARLWVSHYGGTAAHGQIGAHLKPLVKQHGDGEVLRRFEHYLEVTDAQYASPARFAQTFGKWDQRGGVKSGLVESPSDRARRLADELEEAS